MRCAIKRTTGAGVTQCSQSCSTWLGGSCDHHKSTTTKRQRLFQRSNRKLRDSKTPIGSAPCEIGGPEKRNDPKNSLPHSLSHRSQAKCTRALVVGRVLGTAEGVLPGEHHVEHHPQAPEVRAPRKSGLRGPTCTKRRASRAFLARRFARFLWVGSKEEFTQLR